MIAVLIAGAVGMLVSLAGTRGLISYFVRLGKGQPILGAEDHGPVHQMGKQGTPTMGGIAIVLAAATGWVAAHLRGGLAFSDQAAIIWLTVFVLAAIGFLDVYLKVKRQHIRGIFPAHSRAQKFLLKRMETSELSARCLPFSVSEGLIFWVPSCIYPPHRIVD
jgi:phospho-N-acetylmuramoyl-pentapeptide-transferase